MKAFILIGAAALLLSACGGSKSSAPNTVSTQKVSSAGTILVDAKGDALYSSAQEQDGTVRCTGGCAAIWVPLTLPASVTSPTAASSVPGKLAVVRRPDGKRQVTWNGHPLYTFAEDTGSGSVMGNGAKDSFSGMSFTWHVAVATGAAPATTTTGGGGYGY